MNDDKNLVPRPQTESNPATAELFERGATLATRLSTSSLTPEKYNQADDHLIYAISCFFEDEPAKACTAFI